MAPIPAMANKIEVWPIDKLTPYERNARTHSDEQVDKIAASIQEFGFVNPVLVDSEHGIIAGHGRVMAARQLGLTDVPVIVLDHLTDEQRRAYIIADNKLTEIGGWDEDLLAAEVNALLSDDFEIGLVGFTDDELADLLDDDGLEEEPDDEDDETPPDSFDSYDDDIETQYRCPSCRYEWSGKPK